MADLALLSRSLHLFYVPHDLQELKLLVFQSFELGRTHPFFAIHNFYVSERKSDFLAWHRDSLDILIHVWDALQRSIILQDQLVASSPHV